MVPFVAWSRYRRGRAGVVLTMPTQRAPEVLGMSIGAALVEPFWCPSLLWFCRSHGEEQRNTCHGRD